MVIVGRIFNIQMSWAPTIDQNILKWRSFGKRAQIKKKKKKHNKNKTHTQTQNCWVSFICVCSWGTLIYHMYSDRQAWANSVDTDETPQNAASHQGLHYLPLIQQYLEIKSGSELYLVKF